MCDYCDIDSGRCCIFANPLTNEWYLSLETNEWDVYDDQWVYVNEYIEYCPYCGRKLSLSNMKEEDDK